MERVSRRSLLATASAGAAVAGVVAVAGPAATAQAAPAAPAAPPKAAPLADHAIARVKDLSTGEVDLFIGQKQVTVRDAALANAIAHAAQQHTA